MTLVFQWEFLPILGNEPDDCFIYQLTFNIGKDSNPNFSTPVFCVIYGDQGKTTPKALVDGQRKVIYTIIC